MAPSCPCVNTINWVDLGGSDFKSYLQKIQLFNWIARLGVTSDGSNTKI